MSQGYNRQEIDEIEKITGRRRDEFLEAWRRFFA